jgi:hypothetical protein
MRARCQRGPEAALTDNVAGFENTRQSPASPQLAQASSGRSGRKKRGDGHRVLDLAPAVSPTAKSYVDRAARRIAGAWSAKQAGH